LEIGLKSLAVLADHALDAELLQALGGGRHADQAAPMFRHEIYRFRRDKLRRHDQVAFILTVRIVHDDDHFAPPQIFGDRFDGVKPLCHTAWTSYPPCGELPAAKVAGGLGASAQSRQPTSRSRSPPAPRTRSGLDERATPPP